MLSEDVHNREMSLVIDYDADEFWKAAIFQKEMR